MSSYWTTNYFIHEQTSTHQQKEAGKWRKKRKKCNVPSVAIQLQVDLSEIFVRVAA
jgi:hypothetical protein